MRTIQHIQHYAFFGCIGCICLLLAGLALDGGLPDASEIDASVKKQPIQGGYSGPEFALSHDGLDYIIEPVATYDVTALIVSENELDQDAVEKYGLSQDLGMIWGENTADDRFQEYKFSSGSYVLYAEVPHGVAFNSYEMGNVHILPANPEVAEALDEIETGAQVRLQGKLINYSRVDLGPGKRKSSLTRTDTGMGACETMLVEKVEIISNPNAKYAGMAWLGSWGLLGSIMLLVAATLYIGLTNEPDPRAGINNHGIFGGDDEGSFGEGKHSTLLYYLFFPFLGRWRG